MKAVVKMPCEDGNCKHNHDMLVDLDELGVKIQNKDIPSANITRIPEMQINNIPKPEPEQPKKLTHDEIGDIIPKGNNYFKCMGSDCGHKKLKHKEQVKKFKSCPNCRNNSIPKSNDYCPTCGIDENDKKFEEWEESDIEIQQETEDDE